MEISFKNQVKMFLLVARTAGSEDATFFCQTKIIKICAIINAVDSQFQSQQVFNICKLGVMVAKFSNIGLLQRDTDKA